MKMNPVYRREITVSARSSRLAFTLLCFNGILALVALLNMYSTLEQVQLTAEIQYSSFLDLYLFVAVLEFVMLIFIMPAITAGMISGERERQTLELMMTTKMRPGDIVLGKFASALGTMLLLICSSFPIIAIVFVYGGITLRDIGLLLLCYVTSAFLVGSMGLFCSVLFKKTTFSTVAAYVLTGLIVAGTYGINQFALYLNGMRGDSYLAAVEQTQAASSGGFLYLMLLNPIASFLVMISRLTGQQQVNAEVTAWFGEHSLTPVLSQWLPVSLVLQLAVGGLFLSLAVYLIRPGSWSK